MRSSSTCIRSRVCASSAANGSSISSTLGSVASARARPTRCFMPPDSSCGKCPSKPASPIISISGCDTWRRASPAMPLSSRPELDVVLHGAPGQQAELLEHHRPVGARAGDRLAVHPDIAGIRPDQAEQDIEEGALAAAGGADDRQEFAFADVDVEVLQRAHRPAVRRPEGEVDVATLNIRLHAIRPRPAPLYPKQPGKLSQIGRAGSAARQLRCIAASPASEPRGHPECPGSARSSFGNHPCASIRTCAAD